MCRLSRLQLNVAPDVYGISDEHAVEELDVVSGFGLHEDIDAKFGIVPRGVEDVAVRCAGGQSGHGEGAREVKRRFEGAVADADTEDVSVAVALVFALDGGMSKVMYSSASWPVKVPLEEEVTNALGIVTRMWASEVVNMAPAS